VKTRVLIWVAPDVTKPNLIHTELFMVHHAKSEPTSEKPSRFPGGFYYIGEDARREKNDRIIREKNV